jgi:hypothetical protein
MHMSSPKNNSRSVLADLYFSYHSRRGGTPYAICLRPNLMLVLNPDELFLSEPTTCFMNNKDTNISQTAIHFHARATVRMFENTTISMRTATRNEVLVFDINSKKITVTFPK